MKYVLIFINPIKLAKHLIFTAKNGRKHTVIPLPAEFIALCHLFELSKYGVKIFAYYFTERCIYGSVWVPNLPPKCLNN